MLRREPLAAGDRAELAGQERVGGELAGAKPSEGFAAGEAMLEQQSKVSRPTAFCVAQRRSRDLQYSSLAGLLGLLG